MTTQQTGDWVLPQLRKAFPYDTGQGRRLIHDSDPVFSRDVLGFIANVGTTLH